MKNINTVKKLSNILLVLSFSSIHLSLLLIASLGEIDIFGISGALKYMWIMWLFLPIPVLTYLSSLVLHKNNEKYRLKLVVSIIVVILLLAFGSSGFFSQASYDPNLVNEIEAITGIELPNNIKVGAFNDVYSIDIRAKITDDEERINFENELLIGELWQTEFSNGIGYLLSPELQISLKADTYEYMLFYNVTEDLFNQYPTNETCEYIFILYDMDESVITILHQKVISENFSKEYI